MLQTLKQVLAGAALMVLSLAPSIASATDVTTYFHNDPAGSPVVATDASGNVVWKASYRPYGQEIDQPAAGANNEIWFHGKPYEPATGLSYSGARYYDPITGRFMGVDAVGFSEHNVHSFNRYAYGNNNPYRFVDPDGNAPDETNLGGGGRPGVGPNILRQSIEIEASGNANRIQDFQGSGANQRAIREAFANRDVNGAMQRGRQSETRVLNDIGEVKNTASVGQTGRKSIPDFQNSKQVGEIKDTQRVTDSQQLRTQREHAATTGREHVVVTGTQTRVSGTVEAQSTVIRRSDLGPQGQ